MFFRSNERKGLLHVCEKGKRDLATDKDNLLQLNQVTDVFKDKNAPMYKTTQWAAAAVPERCFSFKTVATTFHAEFESKEVRDSWFEALKTILSAKSPKAPAGGAATPSAAVRQSCDSPGRVLLS